MRSWVGEMTGRGDLSKNMSEKPVFFFAKLFFVLLAHFDNLATVEQYGLTPPRTLHRTVGVGSGCSVRMLVL